MTQEVIETFIGRVCDHISDTCVDVQSLECDMMMPAFGLNADDWPLGTVVLCTRRLGRNWLIDITRIDAETLKTLFSDSPPA